MKTAAVERDLECSSNFQQNAFTINASVKAFKILSDGLYSDKITAIIRELSCNAYDSHIEAGNVDEQFDVHLPTRFAPEFYVRDYGTGLSKDDIENIYTTYFESTKTNSNDAIGCLGLGSKSPFSYVDLFTVTSYFNGMQYVYSAFICETGTPSIALMAESETQERNGLKVQFAVKNMDMNDFSYKAQKIFFYFDQAPKFLGHKPNISTRSYIVKNKNWGLTENRHGGVLALMGNVAYPVTLSKVDFTEQERTILTSFPIDMFFAIGDLEVNASREGLSYDKRTTSAIVGLVREIIKQERERIEKELEKQECYWDAVCWFNKEKSTNQVVNLLFCRVPLEYKGRKISDFFTLSKKEFSEGEGLGKVDKLNLYRLTPKDRWSQAQNSNVNTLGNPEMIWKILIGGRNKFFINDCKNRHMVRAKQYYAAHKDDIDTIYLIKSEDEKLIDLLIERLGIKKEIVTKLSDIEPIKVVRKKKGNSAIGHLVEMSYSSGTWSDSADYWNTIEEEDDFDIDEGGFYVVINRWKTVHNDIERSPREFLSPLNSLFQAIVPLGKDGKRPNVYGVKKAKADLLEGKKKWINWIDYVQKVIRDHALSPKVNKELQAICNSAYFNYGTLGSLFTNIQYYDIFKDPKGKLADSKWMNDCECPIVNELAERYDLDKKTRGAASGTHRSLLDFINEGLSTLTQVERDSLNEYKERHKILIEKFQSEYLLLQDSYIFYRNVSGISHVLRYINAINKSA